MFLPLAATPDGVDDGAWSEACADVRASCGWHIAPSIEEDLVLDDGRGSSTTFGFVRLLLPSLQLTAVSAVSVDGVAVDVAGVRFQRRGVVDIPNASLPGSAWPGWWSDPGPVVTVSVTHGYDECPKELLGVLRDLVKVGGVKVAQRSVVGPFAHDWSRIGQGGPGGVLEAYAGRLGRYTIEPRP